MEAQVKNQTEEVAYARNQVNGEAMRRLSARRKTLMKAAEVQGVAPFSVWNFNPTEAIIWVLGSKLSVPAFNSKLGIKRTVPFGEEERAASVVVFRELKGYASPTSAQNEAGGDPQAPQMGYDWRVMHPVEQVRAFEHNYNSQSGAMGGVLVFQGDSHTIGRSSEQVIHIPHVVRGDDGTLIYTTEKVSLAQKLDQILSRQRDYCFRRLQLAQEWTDQGEISSVHDGPGGFTAWGRFAVHMGWKHQSELGWMVSDSAAASCDKCGKRSQSGTALFCSCGAPYDAFKAYMAGHKVDLDYLAALPEEKLKLVKAEMHRRENLFKFLDEPKPEVKAKAKPEAKADETKS